MEKDKELTDCTVLRNSHYTFYESYETGTKEKGVVGVNLDINYDMLTYDVSSETKVDDITQRGKFIFTNNNPVGILKMDIAVFKDIAILKAIEKAILFAQEKLKEKSVY